MAHPSQASFTVRLAQTPADLAAAKRLRYQVFVQELGGCGAEIDHAAGLEQDAFDAHCDHLLLEDTARGAVVGVYRLLQAEGAARAGGYYSEGEYDLAPLKASGRRLLELGRSCVHPSYRGGMAMHHLWSGVADYVAQHQIEVLFGVASFHGTDTQALAQPLSLLHHHHLSPSGLRVRALDKSFQNMDLLDKAQLDRKAAILAMPSLIKAYLRLGGCVGEGAFVDHTFNTVDVCLILDTARLRSRQARIYAGESA